MINIKSEKLKTEMEMETKLKIKVSIKKKAEHENKGKLEMNKQVVQKKGVGKKVSHFIIKVLQNITMATIASWFSSQFVQQPIFQKVVLSYHRKIAKCTRFSPFFQKRPFLGTRFPPFFLKPPFSLYSFSPVFPGFPHKKAKVLVLRVTLPFW